MATDDPEAYQNWVRSAEKQRIQVCWHLKQNNFWQAKLILVGVLFLCAVWAC